MAEWQRHLAKFASRVESRLEEQRERLGMTGEKRARIDAYRGFGRGDRAWVKACPAPASATACG